MLFDSLCCPRKLANMLLKKAAGMRGWKTKAVTFPAATSQESHSGPITEAECLTVSHMLAKARAADVPAYIQSLCSKLEMLGASAIKSISGLSHCAKAEYVWHTYVCSNR